MDTTTMLLGILIAVTAVGFAVCLRELRAMQRSVDTLEQALRREITRSHEAQESRLLKIANRLEVRPSIVPPEDGSEKQVETEKKATEKKAEVETEKEPETARAPLPSAHVEDEPTDSEDETKLLAKPPVAQITSAKPEPEKKEEPKPEKKAEAKPVDMTGVALAKMALGMKAGEASLDSDDELTIQAGARKSSP